MTAMIDQIRSMILRKILIREKKILLVTLYGDFNYGNVLQRYALAKILEAYGFEVEHLCTVFKSSLIIKKIKQAIKLILALIGIEKYRRKFRQWLIKRKYRSLQLSREQFFTIFQKNFTKIFMTYREALDSAKSRWDGYDFVVTGSDQVWNGFGSNSALGEPLRYYYLEFMPREKRVNYAPSFGFSKFPKHDIKFHKNGLAGFDRLSCREQEGVDLIRQLTGLNAQLVLDPTLLLNSEDWCKLETKPKCDLPEHYMLCYFLGEITSEYSQAINKAAEKLHVIIIHENEEIFYLTGPAEILYLFNHADFICTDSFHGTAFSVNFGKNFMAFRRVQEGMTDMFGRIEGLLSALGLTERIYNGKICTSEINYDEVYEKLNVMRESSMKYLRECLKIE